MLALQSLADPGPGLVPQPHRARARAGRVRAGRGRRAIRPWRRARRPMREQARTRSRQHPGDDGPREPRGRVPRVDGLHADHVGAAGPDGRAAAHDDGRRSRASLRRLPHHGPDRTSTRSCPTARRRATTTTSSRTSTPWTAWCSATPCIASRTRTRPGSSRRAAGCPRRGASRCSSSCGATTPSSRAIPPPPPPPSCRASALPRRRPRVLRDGWGPDSTWIEFSCGPYFAKHDHLDTNQFVDLPPREPGPRHRRRLHRHREPALPELLPPHRRPQHDARVPARRDLLLGREQVDRRQRRRPAHGLVALLELGAQPRRTGGRTRDLWDRGHDGRLRLPCPAATPTCAATAPAPITRARSSASSASSSGCRARASLFVLDRVRSTDPSFRKAWLLHGVAEPKVEGGDGGADHRRRAARAYGDARVVTFEDGQGRLRVHSVLPAGARRHRARRRRAGSSGRRATSTAGPGAPARTGPSIPPEGGPLPDDPVS